MTRSLATFKRARSWLTRQKISRALRGRKRKRGRKRLARAVIRTGAAGLGLGAISGRYRAKERVSQTKRSYDRQLSDVEKQIQETRTALNAMGPAEKRSTLSLGEPEKERQRMINRKVRKNRRRMDDIDVEVDRITSKRKLTKADWEQLRRLNDTKKSLRRQNNRYQDRKQRLGERVARLKRDARGATPTPSTAEQQRTSTQAQLKQLNDQKRTLTADRKVALETADTTGRRGILKAAAIGAGVGLGAGAVGYGINRLRKKVQRNRRKRRRGRR